MFEIIRPNLQRQAVYCGAKLPSKARLADAKRYAEFAGYKYLSVFDYGRLVFCYKLPIPANATQLTLI
jgi:hypothetical protein